jgi:hypothetical protein
VRELEVAARFPPGREAEEVCVKDWQRKVMDAATPKGEHPIWPGWSGSVPLCMEECGQHDGKRCRLLGVRPDRLCEPAVAAMGDIVKEKLS